MQNENTVCAVVVTYNRKKLLIECLVALENQTRPLNAILILDNASTDDTPELLLKNNYIERKPPKNLCKIFESSTKKENLNFHYIRMTENTGGAGGFYEGVKKAYEKGYDWLWLMDDDSEPYLTALEKFSKYYDKENISALVNLKINLQNEISVDAGYFNFKKNLNEFRDPKICYPINVPVEKEEINNNSFLEIDMSSFVGILVNKKAIDKINFPKKEFFIHVDDTEYCIRLRKVGKILLINDSIIIHKDFRNKNKIEKRFMGKIYSRVAFEGYWIKFFTIRNSIWLGKLYNQNKLIFYYDLIYSCFILIIGIILLDDHRLKRINLLINAYFDGLNGTFENDKAKKILYH